MAARTFTEQLNRDHFIKRLNTATWNIWEATVVSLWSCPWERNGAYGGILGWTEENYKKCCSQMDHTSQKPLRILHWDVPLVLSPLHWHRCAHTPFSWLEVQPESFLRTCVTPSSNPLMTSCLPILNLKGLFLSLEESNFFPFCSIPAKTRHTVSVWVTSKFKCRGGGKEWKINVLVTVAAHFHFHFEAASKMDKAGESNTVAPYRYLCLLVI